MTTYDNYSTIDIRGIVGDRSNTGDLPFIGVYKFDCRCQTIRVPTVEMLTGGCQKKRGGGWAVCCVLPLMKYTLLFSNVVPFAASPTSLSYPR
jgi:hypothetical protein